MSVEKQAGVRVKLSGDEEIAAQTQKMGNAWGEIGSKASGAFRSMGSAIGGAVQGVLSDIGHIVSAAGTISFAASVQSVDRLEESVARMGVASGRSVASVQAGINSLSQEIGELPEKTEAWVHSVGDLTYSYERAAQSAAGLQGYALQTGQSLQQVAPLAVVLDQIGAGGEKAGHALDVMAKQAEMLGTVGGPKALGDMLNHLGSQITGLSAGEGTNKITALMAGFGGNKGLTPQQREGALGGILGRVGGNVEGFERHFGMKHGEMTDEYGHLKSPTEIMAKLQAYGAKGKGQRNRLEYTFGREQTAAIMHTDIAAIRAAENAQGEGAGGHALARFADTPAGKKHQQEVDKDIAMQKVVGHDSLIGKARNWIGDQSAKNPLTTMAATLIGGKLAGSAAGGIFNMLGFGGGAAATGAGTTAVASTGGGLATAGLGGAALSAGGIALAGMAAQFGLLSMLGEGSAAKQGFSNRVIGRDEAASLSDKAKSAEAAAAGNRSPGMQAAMAAEQIRLDEAKAKRAAAAGGGASGGGAPGGVDPKMAAMIDQLVKAGASLQLAQETASKLMQGDQRPIQIEIINPTGADIDARPRGQQ